MAPKEVYGEDFPGETFRVLKEKEVKQFGEYRTRRLVLDAWDEIEERRQGMTEEWIDYDEVFSGVSVQ